VIFTRSHWWRTSMGRHVFSFMMVLAILFGLGILRRVIGPEWFEAHREALWFWSFFATFVVAWWRVLLLVIAQGFNPDPEHPTSVPNGKRVVVEGENQQVSIEGTDDDPDTLDDTELARG
jgi:hypothetical protein